MCNCMTMCRVPEMMNTHDGKYPPSEHHPNCEDFELEEFVRLEYDGQICITRPLEAEVMVNEDGVVYNVSKVMLTRDQFENLPEFAGF